MIPSSLATVVGFLFFVAPGLLFELLLGRRRPTKVESAFGEASRVALFSAPFTIVSTAAVVLVVHHLNQHWLDLIVQWSTTGKPPSAGAMIAAALLALIEVALACIGVLVVSLIAAWKLRKRKFTPKSAWSYSLTPPAGSSTIVTVITTDGTQYRGQVLGFSPDLPWEEREITLCQPLSVLRDKELSPLPEQFLLLHSSSIASISAVWIDTEIVEAASRR
jgi:hypothetical protein